MILIFLPLTPMINVNLLVDKKWCKNLINMHLFFLSTRCNYAIFVYVFIHWWIYFKNYTCNKWSKVKKWIAKFSCLGKYLYWVIIVFKTLQIYFYLYFGSVQFDLGDSNTLSLCLWIFEEYSRKILMNSYELYDPWSLCENLTSMDDTK